MFLSKYHILKNSITQFVVQKSLIEVFIIRT
jgi:hypothetical protein